MNQLNLLLCVVFPLVFICSCNSEGAAKDEKPAIDSASPIPATNSVRPVHWSYNEKNGPAGWSELTPVYALCGSGKFQSPIDLLPDAGKGSSGWTIDYKTTTLQIEHTEHVEELINNGHTIQVTPQAGSKIIYAGKNFQLKQFHFHTPSEHTLNGKHLPMEMHFVHQSDDKRLAVIGVLVQEGKYNDHFDPLIKHLPNAPGERKTDASVNIDIKIHVPKEQSAYHYIGSLTTPPCTEDVQWLVLRNPIYASKEQIAAFSSRLKNNNRPTQGLRERTLTIEDIINNH